MKNLKKLQKDELKKIVGGINCTGGQLCYRNGKWVCVAYDTCGGWQI
ncbi:bacteriocin-like protein [Chryseobacterium daecheongense]|uniref:Bacteriocin-like protein n=1 Tax=Chryseobacterium daecheongense TaxID=192389 RepID=A0ABY2FY60_9FLAO|nr:bacteriocin-like protein [Chryseobacterium daecheongense]